MNVVALVSGGKDSTMNMLRCVEHGHKIVALANLYPAGGDGDELDSFMYQTVGHEGIEAISECMGLPLYRRPVRKGTSLSTELEYSSTKGDEVEELHTLLARVKKDMPHVNAVASGAILSNYQRTRVESVCMRLGLTSLAYLWMEEQDRLLDEMVDGGVEAILIKVACMGLSSKHLGKDLASMRATLHKLNAQYGAHICGEGGEFESYTVDCPLYSKRIVVQEPIPVTLSDDEYAPVAYLRMPNLRLEAKDGVPPAESTGSSIIIVDDQQGDAESGGGASEPHVHAPHVASSTWQHTTLGIRTVFGEWSSVEEEAEAVLISIEEELKRRNVAGGWSSVHLVGVYLADMSDFAAVNRVYSKRLPMRCPAARLCVGVSLGEGARVGIECAASPLEHETLHVQSISRWAPSNIGPYSQAKTLGKRLVLVSGQIALDPPTMLLGGGGQVADEAKICLANLEAILKVCGSSISDGVRLTAYVVSMGDAKGALEAWREAGGRGSANVACVRQLPRGAKVELQLACVKSLSGTADKAASHGDSKQQGIACWGANGRWCSACGSAVSEGEAKGLGARLATCMDEFGLASGDIVSVRAWCVGGGDAGLIRQGVEGGLGLLGGGIEVSVLPAEGGCIDGVEGSLGDKIFVELLAVRVDALQ